MAPAALPALDYRKTIPYYSASAATARPKNAGWADQCERPVGVPALSAKIFELWLCPPIRWIAFLLVGASALLAQQADDAAAPPRDPTKLPAGVLGKYESAITSLNSPAGVAIDQRGRIYVAETGGRRIRVFDSNGRPIREFGTETDPPLLNPTGVAVADNGHVFVSDTGNNRVVEFSPKGVFVRSRGRRGCADGEFINPGGIALSGKWLYVADTGNNRVQRLDLGGPNAQIIGRFGQEPGSFNSPLDVCVDAQGSLYVADYDNQRIQKFDSAGQFITTWGDWGAAEALLAGPRGVEYHDGLIYVADSHNHRIQAFDTSGKFRYAWGEHVIRPYEGEGKIHYPDQVAVAPSGEFAVVCESWENRCQVFGRVAAGEKPKLTQWWEVGQAMHYGPLADVAGHVMVMTETEGHRIMVFDVSREEPILIGQFGGYGTKPTRFIRPADVKLDPDSMRLYIADAGNRRLQIFRLAFDPGGVVKFRPGLAKFVKSIDLVRLGQNDPQLRDGPVIEPIALERDDRGNTYLISANHPFVLVFDPKFNFMGSLGSGADEGHPLQRPADLCFEPSSGQMYVVDAQSGWVAVFDRERKFTFAWGGLGTGEGKFTKPVGITRGSDGTIYVVDAGADRVQAFDGRGKFQMQWGSTGLGASQFFKPVGVVQDERKRLIIVDYGNHRGMYFKADGKFISAFGPRLFVRPTRSSGRPQPTAD